MCTNVINIYEYINYLLLQITNEHILCYVWICESIALYYKFIFDLL